MRHFRSILYALVLAPAVWVLAGAGLTHDLTTRGRDDFAIESGTGLLLLLLAGAAYAILLLAPISPAGPLLAGLALLGISIWALAAPDGYAGLWPADVAKEGFDLSRPGYGLAALLALPLICTALSARRWERYEPPVLPIIGQIGRARGKAPVAGTSAAALETVTLATTTDADRTAALPTAGDAEVTTVLPPAVAPSDDTTTVLPGAAPASGSPAVAASSSASGAPEASGVPEAAGAPESAAAEAAGDSSTTASASGDPDTSEVAKALAAPVDDGSPVPVEAVVEGTPAVVIEAPEDVPTYAMSTTLRDLRSTAVVVSSDEATSVAALGNGEASTNRPMVLPLVEETVDQPVAAESAPTEPAADEKVAAERVTAEAVAPERGTAEAVAAEPTAVGAIAGEPVAAEAVVAEPAEVQAVAAEAVAAEPEPAEPVAAEAVVADPVPAEPAAAEANDAQPESAEPVAAEAVVAEPESAEPVAAETVTAETAAVEPVAAEPVAVEPVAVSAVLAADDAMGAPDDPDDSAQGDEPIDDEVVRANLFVSARAKPAPNTRAVPPELEKTRSLNAPDPEKTRAITLPEWAATRMLAPDVIAASRKPEGSAEPTTAAPVATEPVAAETAAAEPVIADSVVAEPVAADEVVELVGETTRSLDAPDPDRTQAITLPEKAATRMLAPEVVAAGRRREPLPEPAPAEPVAAEPEEDTTRSLTAPDPDATRTLTAPDPDATRSLTAPDPDATRLLTAPDPDRTQAIKLDAGDVMRLPSVRPAEEPVPVSAAPAATSTGDIGGDETQVIRLATADPERTQVIRPGSVEPPGERTEIIRIPVRTTGVASASDGPTEALTPVSIADAERPNFAEDPTSRIVPPDGRAGGDGERRQMTVMNMERPPEEEVTQIPVQRQPS